MEVQEQQPVFNRSENFEINDIEFREITINDHRLQAEGKSWTRFVLRLSFIGGAWMEKWRRFGAKVLAAGILVAAFPFYAPFLLGLGFTLYGPLAAYMLPIFTMLGTALILLWALVKREALKIYTPSETFKLEGSAGFIEAVWSAIMARQASKEI